MSKTKNVSTEQEMEISTRSEAIDLTPTEGRAVLAAWQGMYHLFGGRVESWEITSEGIIGTGFTVDGQYDPRQLIQDISGRERRLDLLGTYSWLHGEAPANFVDAAELTAFTVQFYKGSVEENSAKSPAYVKQAVAAYKAANALTKKRGPKTKIFRLDNLGSLDVETLQNVDTDELAKFQAVVERVMAQKKAEAASMVTTA